MSQFDFSSNKNKVPLWIEIIAPAVLLTAIWITFFPTLKNGFVGWDDGPSILYNFRFRGFSWSNLRWMFTTFHMGHYQPLSWVTLSLDYSIWELNPFGFHLTNLIIHSANAVTLYLLIMLFFNLRPEQKKGPGRFTTRIAVLVGTLVFAIHPLRVESVAWVTERRDLLSAFFWLLSIISYIKKYKAQSASQKSTWYIYSIVFMLLSMLSKAWAITLPVLFLILDIYPLQRLTGKNLSESKNIFLEKLPYFLIALAFAIIATIAIRHSQAFQEIGLHSLIKRTMQAFYGLSLYSWKTLLPVSLSPLYLLKITFDPFQLKYLASAAAIILVTVVLFLARHYSSLPLASWIVFIVVVSPVLGFTQAGPQIAADRYTYLACMPLAVVFAALVRLFLLKNINTSFNPAYLSAGTAILAAIFITLGWLTWNQVGIWRDSLTLWRHAVQLDNSNYIAIKNRGTAFQEAGALSKAIADYSWAIRLNPKYASAYNNRGAALYQLGRRKQALDDFNTSLLLNPTEAESYYNRAFVRQELGDTQGALEDYDRAIFYRPNYVAALNNRGRLRMAEGNVKEAISDFSAAIMNNPRNYIALNNRGIILRETGKIKAAIADFNKALVINPNYATAFINRGFAYQLTGEYEKAISDYRSGLRVAPPEWPNRNYSKQLLQRARKKSRK